RDNLALAAFALEDDIIRNDNVSLPDGTKHIDHRRRHLGIIAADGTVIFAPSDKSAIEIILRPAFVFAVNAQHDIELGMRLDKPLHQLYRTVFGAIVDNEDFVAFIHRTHRLNNGIERVDDKFFFVIARNEYREVERVVLVGRSDSRRAMKL